MCHGHPSGTSNTFSGWVMGERSTQWMNATLIDSGKQVMLNVRTICGGCHNLLTIPQYADMAKRSHLDLVTAQGPQCLLLAAVAQILLLTKTCRLARFCWFSSVSLADLFSLGQINLQTKISLHHILCLYFFQDTDLAATRASCSIEHNQIFRELFTVLLRECFHYFSVVTCASLPLIDRFHF